MVLSWTAPADPNRPGRFSFSTGDRGAGAETRNPQHSNPAPRSPNRAPIHAITLASRETARASSYVDIRFPDGTTLRWTTKNPLLGPAIEAAFTPRLEQGQDLFITDVVLTPQGKQSAEKIVIPAHTRMNWVHPAANTDDITTLTASVDDHVRTHGGITLDADGNLTDPT